MSVIRTFDLAGTAVFAVTGALVAGRKRMDVFGVAVVGLVTALGGGTLRDLILGSGPVFWSKDTAYVVVALVAAATTFFLAGMVRMPTRALVVADALGLAIFTIVGAQRALDGHFSPLIAVVMGTMTGVFGGIVRDLLCGEVPLILRKEVYATASLAGGLVFVLFLRLQMSMPVAAVIAAAVILVIRLAAIHWGLSLPTFRAPENEAQ